MIKTLYEKFQHWSYGGSVYLYSDPHFNDADCVYMDPNWMPPDEQVDVINYIVKRPDTFICRRRWRPRLRTADQGEQEDSDHGQPRSA